MNKSNQRWRSVGIHAMSQQALEFSFEFCFLFRHSINNINESTKWREVKKCVLDTFTIGFEFEVAAMLNIDQIAFICRVIQKLICTWFRFYFVLLTFFRLFAASFYFCYSLFIVFQMFHFFHYYYILLYFISGNYHYQLSLSTCFDIFFYSPFCFHEIFQCHLSMGERNAFDCHAFSFCFSFFFFFFFKKKRKCKLHKLIFLRRNAI